MDTSELIPKLEAAAPGAVLEMRPFGRSGEVSLWIEMKSIARVALILRDEPGFHLDWLENLTVMEIDKALVLTYFLKSTRSGGALILRGSVVPPASEEAVDVPSVASVWMTARPFEEELRDLWGVRFSGRQDKGVARSILPSGWIGYPLRKGYVFPPEFLDIPHMRPAGQTSPDEHGRA